jgi:hypothetical protein
MSRHVGADRLAMRKAGATSAYRARRIDAHLAGCAQCRKLAADLDSVSSVLASARAPALPGPVAARIEGALAAESARRASAAGAGEGQPQPADAGEGQPQPAGARRAGPRRPRLASPIALRLAAGAAAAVVLGGAGYGIAQIVGGPSSPPTASSGQPASSARAAPSYGPKLPYQEKNGHSASFTPVQTSTDFEPSTLGSQLDNEIKTVHSTVYRPQSAPNLAPTSTGTPSALSGQFAGESTKKLDGCVARVAAGRPLLLVDVARYRGSAAVFIVAQNSAGQARVWVVGPGCSAGATDLLRTAPLPQG